jgi:hypothetical protein
MHNTQPEQKGAKWMKEQIREAALGMILISVISFIIWVFAESKWGDWEWNASLAGAMLVGSAAGGMGVCIRYLSF